jgi:hypothetical protein
MKGDCEGNDGLSWCSSILYVLSALLGVYSGAVTNSAQARLPPESAARIELLLCIATCLGFMWFCTIDAKLVGKPLIQLAKLGIFLGWPIGVPLYLLWARGVRGLGLLLLHGVLLFLVLVCSILAGTYLLQ